MQSGERACLRQFIPTDPRSVLYMLSALLNIILGSCGISQDRRGRSSNTLKSQKKLNLLQNICYYTLCWPPIFVLWKGPAWSILRGRYAKRFMFKFWRGHRGQDDDQELDAFDEKQSRQSISVQALSRLLEQDKVRHAIASNLHYIDMMHLNLTCKGIHRSLVPGGRAPEIYQQLRIWCCESGSKKHCWICVAQVCQVREGFLRPDTVRLD